MAKRIGTPRRGELARRGVGGGRGTERRPFAPRLGDLADHGAILADADRHLLHRVSTDLLTLIGRLAAAGWSDVFARGERQIRTIGEGAEQAVGQAIWNVEIAGPYNPDPEPFYDPGHLFCHHRAGLPLTAAQIVDGAVPMPRERLLEEDRHDPGIAHWPTRLTKAQRDLDTTVAMYERLYQEGPRALSEYDRGVGRRDATRMVLWAEMMAGGYRFLSAAAAMTKGIEEALKRLSAWCGTPVRSAGAARTAAAVRIASTALPTNR